MRHCCSRATRTRRPLNGDADWTDTDEWQDSKTFNKVNEIGTRDLDATPGTTGDNYTLAYDPAGNMTNDGTDYKYEWDAFYRLRKVKTQGGALVAEYRYNGLGYRVGEHWDVNASGLPVDGSDLWYYSAYDERWRMVATDRGSDTAPKERFVHQQAGEGGFGGSSYIDLVAFREKDANTAWTSASDGTLEERLYYCQSQHADVVALITAAGGQREMDRYSAYGVPFGLPTGDCDSDGDAQTDDANQIRAWYLGTPYHYDVRGDLDLDGDLDSSDRNLLLSNYNNVTLGRGSLSSIAVGNRTGVAGYDLVQRLSVIRYHVRSRHLWSDTGSWLQRDPKGYIDGPCLLQSHRSNPARYLDGRGSDVVDNSSMGPLAEGDMWEADLPSASADLSLEFDGEELALVHKRRGVIETWPAVSGKPGTGPHDQRKIGTGPIPAGWYGTGPRLWFNSIWRVINHPYSSWGCSTRVLTPTPGTQTYGRGGFNLHGGTVPGSAGCIDMTMYNDRVQDILDLVGSPSIPVTVNYAPRPKSSKPAVGPPAKPKGRTDRPTSWPPKPPPR